MQSIRTHSAPAPLRRAALLATAFAIALSTAACATLGVDDGPGSLAQRQLAEGIAH